MFSRKNVLRMLRHAQSKNSTLGTLRIGRPYDEEFITLEDVERRKKIYSRTAIPVGKYGVQWHKHSRFNQTYSRLGQKYQTKFYGMPLLENVPDFKGVLIHGGNTHKHTEGCVLLGSSSVQNDEGDYEIRQSQDAFWRFYRILSELIEAKNADVILRIKSKCQPL